MNNEKCRVEDRFVSHERVDELRGGATLVSASPFVQTKSHEHMLRGSHMLTEIFRSTNHWL